MSIPDSFSFYIGGHFGGTYRFELENNEITYRTFLNSDELQAEARIRPSREKWHWFRDQIDKLNIWSWPPDCYEQDGLMNPMVMDGTSWSLKLEYPDQKVQSSGGTDAYPADPGETDFTGETSHCFFVFLKALNELASLPELSEQNPALVFGDAQEPEMDEEE